jgi:hypothetical protein
MQAPRRVFLHDEAVAVVVPRLVSGRLRRPIEPPLSLVGLEVSGALGGRRRPGQASLPWVGPPPIASDGHHRNRGRDQA